MIKPAKMTVQRRTAGPSDRTPGELAALRAVRERFQREKPTLKQVLAETGQKEAMPLGEYLQLRELLHALQLERKRQHLSLAVLAERTGYDAATLSRLFTGRQANTTLGTVGRIANALGKELVLFLRNLAASSANTARARKQKTSEEEANNASQVSDGR